MTGASAKAAALPAVAVRRCRVCGCTDENACLIEGIGPCWWVGPDSDSACALAMEFGAPLPQPDDGLFADFDAIEPLHARRARRGRQRVLAIIGILGGVALGVLYGYGIARGSTPACSTQAEYILPSFPARTAMDADLTQP